MSLPGSTRWPTYVRAASLALSASAIGEPPPVLFEVDVTKQLMGTRVEARLVCTSVERGKAALLDAFMEMERVSARFGYDPDTSEIERINRNAGVKKTPLTGETYRLLERAIGYAAETDGVFDITVGALSRAWGFGPEAGAIHRPDAVERRALRDRVGIGHLVLDPADSTAWVSTLGVVVDVGGIAKGYAVDRAASGLRSAGFDRFFLSAGGDVFASGTTVDDRPWRVGVRHPRDAGSLSATISLSDAAVATSGDYERFEIVDGERIHHIFDPRTAAPGKRSQSASVIAPTAEEADVLATVLFIRGLTENAGSPVPVRSFVWVDINGAITADEACRDEHDFRPGVEPEPRTAP